jgi:hypothetical protein
MIEDSGIPVYEEDGSRVEVVDKLIIKGQYVRLWTAFIWLHKAGNS